MHELNGVAVFEAGEDSPDHPAFRELNTVSLGDVRFPYGFFIVDESGERYVRPATEAERVELLRKVFPDGPSESVLSSNLCYIKDGGCGDLLCHTLKPPHRCFRGYDESRRQYGCWCESIA
ncbi:hypothetical protein A5722_06100 [Mycobacterium vulneris]|uniref:hypothetical protein n=1 Tax=Mycolicibacterium porcinum TaxID=39693 RepID=UPI00080AEC10|nr:hypothetical protein [Mycolicibacterium porcinum]OCB59069.1 hypothetical protein A5722_06100 [Mycolicibacterium vulneris]OCB60708.1 hypothetical protein A5729_32920 [Mycolicibacterium vulneris]ODR27449.1 hypothetical protein BHQ19_01630 [Mycolicibacterium porcinum]